MGSDADKSEIPAEKGSEVESTTDQVFQQTDRTGLLVVYWITLKEILFNTGAFFSRLPPDRPYQEPFLFAAITATLALLGIEFVQLFKGWLLTNLSSPLPKVQKNLLLGHYTFFDLCRLVSMVLVGSMGQVIACHLALRRVCTTYQGFHATWSVYFYSQAAQLAYSIPFVGNTLGPLWFAVVLIVGLAKKHNARIETALFATLVMAAATVLMQICLQIFIVWFTRGSSLNDSKSFLSLIVEWM